MWRRYTEGIDGMEGVIEEFVAARRGEVDEHDDLLSILLSATDEADEAMSEELLRDELMTFLFAGHETTATALTFTWFLLARHPEVDRKLVAELDAVLDGEPPSFADLPDLEYTEQVLREAMWLYPPVPQIPRDTTEPVELGGYGIPEGATVAACQWTVRRDGNLWAYPHEFRPKRFETDDRPRFSYFPFGGGPRRCIGEQFAMVEGKLILATLARRYRLEIVSDPDVDLPVSITTRPLDPIETRVEPRDRGRSWPPAGSPPRPTTGRVPHPGTVAVLVGSRLKRPPPCRRGVAVVSQIAAPESRATGTDATAADVTRGCIGDPRTDYRSPGIRFRSRRRSPGCRGSSELPEVLHFRSRGVTARGTDGGLRDLDERFEPVDEHLSSPGYVTDGRAEGVLAPDGVHARSVGRETGESGLVDELLGSVDEGGIATSGQCGLGDTHRRADARAASERNHAVLPLVVDAPERTVDLDGLARFRPREPRRQRPLPVDTDREFERLVNLRGGYRVVPRDGFAVDGRPQLDELSRPGVEPRRGRHAERDGVGADFPEPRDPDLGAFHSFGRYGLPRVNLVGRGVTVAPTVPAVPGGSEIDRSRSPVPMRPHDPIQVPCVACWCRDAPEIRKNPPTFRFSSIFGLY
jgi:hypothetical protein